MLSIKKMFVGKAKTTKLMWVLSFALAFLLIAAEGFAQSNYEFSLKLRRMGNQIGAEIWARSLNTSAPKLGSMTFPVTYNSAYLSPASLTYDLSKTDSVDSDVNQAPNLPYREITSLYNSANGYNALMGANGSGYSEIEATFTGSASTEGVQPLTTGRGYFIGKLVFNIINHATLSDVELCQIALKTSGIPAMVISDVNGNIKTVNTDFTVLTPEAMSIRGITVLNPNGPTEVVNMSATYSSLTVAGYPVYFERSGLVNPSVFNYGTDAVAYTMGYSLDGGSSWTNDVLRVAETTNPVAAAAYDNMASGSITTKTGTLPGYTITKGSGSALTSGYNGIVRVIWKADEFFAFRSEQAKIKICQIATSGTGADIDLRSTGTVCGTSNLNFTLSRLFFVQLDGATNYFKTACSYSNATQLTAEAWINLNAQGADGTNPGIMVSSAGPASPEEGAWMLYLKDGKYPAFRAREIMGRGTNGYIAELVSPYALSVANSDITLNSSVESEAHRNNWVHVAATVANNVVTLYVNGQSVATYTNTNAVDIRMKTFTHPIWIGVNPNLGIDAVDYIKAGIKEARVWRVALSADQMLQRASGVNDPAGITSAINPVVGSEDLRAALELYYGFQGNRSDLASNTTYQNGTCSVDYYKNDVITNNFVPFRPDKGHIKIISPIGGDGVKNKVGDTFQIRWIGYGLGSTATNSHDIQIEYSRDGGSNWAEALDNTVMPAGLPLNQVEIESGYATWKPYNSVTESGAYHDLQGIANPTSTNYAKSTIIRISGITANGQSNIYDVSSAFYVAPNFGLRINENSQVYVPAGMDLNLTNAVTFLEAWINPYRFPTVTEGYMPILSKTDGTTGHYLLSILPTGQLQFTLTDAAGVAHVATSDANLPLKQAKVETTDSLWSHVGVYVNLANGNGQSTIKFYIDGTPQTSDALTTQLGSNVVINPTNTLPTYFGYKPGTDSKSFLGELREVRFWNSYPAAQQPTGLESADNPTDMTKFIQGALTVHAADLLTAPINYQENLVAAFSFNGGEFFNAGTPKSITSTNSNVKALVNTNAVIGVASNGTTYMPTRPYLKLVEPVFQQIVPNSTTALRVRWVGYDYDGVSFKTGDNATNEDSDMEYSVEGGGGVIIQPYEFVSSTKFNAAYTNAMSLGLTTDQRFLGTTSQKQYGSVLNVSIADPDLNNDKIYTDQSPIGAANTNARLRLTGRATINSVSPYSFNDFTTLRTEGQLFSVTPPSNFTVRALLEGFHSGSDQDINNVGTTFDNLGIKISLFNTVAGLPGTKVDSNVSTFRYENANSLNAGLAPNRGLDGSKFANIPFIFTKINDGKYFVVLEHLNHLPIMSRYAAPFFYNGDDLNTWTIESGWDFQTWGQNATPTATDKMNISTDNIYSGNGLYSAYGSTEINKNVAGFDKTGLNFTQGQETATSNRMAALVAGDVLRDGKIDAADRIQVRSDIGSNTHRSDVTGDGFVNGLDRDIVDRNSNKISSLVDLTVVTYGANGQKQDVPMFPYMVKGNPLETVSPLDPAKSIELNDAAKAFIANGSKRTESKESNTVLGGLNYKVTAETKLEGDIVKVSMYITNIGGDFAPGNCTFGLTYDPNKLDYTQLDNTTANPFANRLDLGYDKAYSAPKAITPDPLGNVRTIEIDYDGYVRPTGWNVPRKATLLGTINFKVKSFDTDQFSFGWNKMTVVLTTDGKNVTKDGTFDIIAPIQITKAAAITVPNGGEAWRPSKLYSITWLKPTADVLANIEFSADNGATWTKITSAPVNVYNSAYNWTTPKVNSTMCLIRLVKADGTEIDRSNAPFSILPAPSYITRPSAADPIYRGGVADFIKFKVDDQSKVRFEFSDNGEGNWMPVSSSINSDNGQVSWTLPTVNTKKAMVRMLNSETGEVIAVSENFKVLAGSVNITSPRTNDDVKVGEQRAVRWTFDNVSMFDMQFSKDGGVNWEAISRDVNAITGKYTWNVPNINTNKAIVRALWENDPEMEYSRSGQFTISGTLDVEDLTGAYSFEQPAPNPFQSDINVTFSIATEEKVNVNIYNATGMLVATVANETIFAAGTHTLKFNGYDLPSGVYYIHVTAGAFSSIREAIHIK
jgi:hypothetical protein